MTKLPVDELLRLACIYAEQDREGIIAAYPEGDPYAVEQIEFLKQLRAYRKKRWGQTKLEDAIETGSPKSIAEIVEGTG